MKQKLTKGNKNISETKSWSFEKIKIDKFLFTLIKMKEMEIQLNQLKVKREHYNRQ